MRGTLSAGRPGAYAARPSRGGAVRRRPAIAAVAAAFRRRPRRPAARVRHRRRARPARRRRKPAGPPADPPDLRDHPAHHHQRPAAHAGRARAHGAAMAAAAQRSAGGRHQPGRPVLPGRSGQRQARHPVPFRHPVGRHGGRQGASVLRLYLFGLPVAPVVAGPCAAAQRRSVRRAFHAAELPVHRTGPPHGGGRRQIRAADRRGRAPGRPDEARIPAGRGRAQR
ncbi:hypothetical protein D3C72_1426450 [compost metagenome]